VTYRDYPNEDHFLIFTSTERVTASIAAWMRQIQ
jgi:hypothetical protein